MRGRSRPPMIRAGCVLAALSMVVACSSAGHPPASHVVSEIGIHKIKHVIVIMQENRSFDSYFGTFPGALGLPGSACVPNGPGLPCVKPYVDHADVNGGGPSWSVRMPWPTTTTGGWTGSCCRPIAGRLAAPIRPIPECTNSATPDVMGYHTKSDIPNYWTYAKDFVLQDHMFEPSASWSLPAHLFTVSEWSATCTQHDNPSSCVNDDSSPAGLKPLGQGAHGDKPLADDAGRGADLQVDRPDVPAPQGQGQAGVTTWCPARNRTARTTRR